MSRNCCRKSNVMIMGFFCCCCCVGWFLVVGYKCRVDENSWTGANRKILETEIAHKKFMLQNIEDLDVWCEKAGVRELLLLLL
jgi:hypothetical protein